MELFLYRALQRRVVKFFSAANEYGDDQYYAAISRVGCDNDELEYVVRIKGNMGHAMADANGYGEGDIIVHHFGVKVGVDMDAWLSSADKYLSIMD